MWTWEKVEVGLESKEKTWSTGCEWLNWALSESDTRCPAECIHAYIWPII